MPGCKRRIDEDRWLEKQLKKFKFSQVDANVYESTLAKLRQGARQAFARLHESGVHVDAPSGSHQDSINSPASSTCTNSTDNDSSIEGMSVDILTDGDAAAEERMEQASLCDDCTRNLASSPARSGIPSADSLERCKDCEKYTCHLNYCKVCVSGFCQSCCMGSYDKGAPDAFVCFSCLRH